MRHHPYKLYGVLLLAVASSLVALSIMAFNRDFTPADYVTVHISRAGLQLLPGSDVKERGIIVGSVQSISSTGDGADLHLSQLQHDMAELAAVSRTYSVAAPALLRMLGNLTVTSQTVVEQQHQISAFLDDVTGAADATHDLLARNAANLIAVNKVNRPILSLLARYSPEFPCFFRGYAGLVPRIHKAVAKHPVGISHSAHVVVEFVPSFPTYQYPIDLPQFKDKRGPNCYGLPHP